MRLSSVAAGLALVLLVFTGVTAQTGVVNVRTGIYHGKLLIPDDSTSEGRGVFAAGEMYLNEFPIAFSGSYVSFTSATAYYPETVSSADLSFYEAEYPYDRRIRAVDVLVGYRLSGTAAAGAGWAAFVYTGEGAGYTGYRDFRSQGLAFGAFARLPIDRRFEAEVKVFHVPAADRDAVYGDGKITGFSMAGAYRVNETIGIYAGYRSISVNLDETGERFNTGGLTAAVAFSF